MAASVGGRCLRVLLAVLSWCCSLQPVSAADALEDPTWSPLAVAHCRATCLRQFLPHYGKDSSCKQHRDCFMCWENCELLQSDWSVWGSMCSEQSVCFPGCRQACRFFGGVGGRSAAGQRQQQQQTPVAQTRAFPLLAVAGRELFWPCRLPRNATPAAAAPARLVYVVVWRPDDASHWRQVTQTEQCAARVPSASGSARVLAVDWAGLRTVYTPAWAAPAASLGPVAARDLAAANAAHRPPTPAGPGAASGGGSVWSVEVLSVIHQGVLVIAELSWRAPDKDLVAARRDGGSPLYLVTWEVDGGGITGNLYTDSSCVTLSLWPDTVFHIRVELLWHSRSLSHSAPLRLDTGGASVPAVRRELPPPAPEAAPASGGPAPPPPPPPAPPLGRWPALPWASVYALAALTALALGTPALYLLADCAARACRRPAAHADDKWSLIGHEEAGAHAADLPDSRQQDISHELKRPLEVQA